MTTSTVPKYFFAKDFFDKPFDEQKVAEVKQVVSSVKLRIKKRELPNATNSVIKSREIVENMKEEIKEVKMKILGAKMLKHTGEAEGVDEYLEYYEDNLKSGRILLHLQNLTLLQFKKKEVILAWIYKSNTEKVKQRLTAYKESLGECYEYYEEHSKLIGINICKGDEATTVGDYMGEANLDENIRQIAEELQHESNRIENYFKICC